MISKTVEGYLYEEFKYCECGCGFTVAKYSSNIGREQKFVCGHNTKGKILGARIHNRFCQIDPTHKTYVKKEGWEDWHKYKDGYLCKYCWDKLFYQPSVRKRKLRFKNKRIHLTFEPRTGYCSLCPNNVHDESCKKTHMHHWIYIIILPWYGTIELCNSCHRKEHRKKEE